MIHHAEFCCRHPHRPAFPGAVSWRRQLGTPIIELLDARRCPLCPDVGLRPPAGPEITGYDEDTQVCDCCGTTWMETQEDEILCTWGAGVAARADPWREITGSTGRCALQTARATERDGVAVVTCDAIDLPLTGRPVQPATATPSPSRPADRHGA